MVLRLTKMEKLLSTLQQEKVIVLRKFTNVYKMMNGEEYKNQNNLNKRVNLSHKMLKKRKTLRNSKEEIPFKNNI